MAGGRFEAWSLAAGAGWAAEAAGAASSANDGASVGAVVVVSSKSVVADVVDEAAANVVLVVVVPEFGDRVNREGFAGRVCWGLLAGRAWAWD